MKKSDLVKCLIEFRASMVRQSIETPTKPKITVVRLLDVLNEIDGFCEAMSLSIKEVR